MKEEYDFSQGKRGAVIPAHGKTRVSIFLDDDVLHWFSNQVAGGGNYQSMINDALKQHIERATHQAPHSPISHQDHQ